MNNKEFFRLSILGLSIAIWTVAAALLADSANIHAAVVEAWVQRHSSGPGSASDLARKLVTDRAGDVIVAGQSDNGLTENDLLIFKYSGADGSVIWQHRYNGPENGADEPTGLAVDSAGNVVVASASHGHYYTAKLAAADGALLWERRYGASGYNSAAAAVVVDQADNVIVTGHSAGPESDGYYTAKYAAGDGALIWEKRYNGPSNEGDRAEGVAVDAAGNVFVTGGSERNLHIIKYRAADGAALWERRSNEPEGSIGYLVAVDATGNVVVTGISRISRFGIYPDYYTLKVAGANGALIWEQRYNGPAFGGWDEPHGLALDSNGNAIVTGRSFSSAGGFDYYTAKYAAANGALLWERRFDGPTNSSDFAYGVSVDARGDVLVTGESWGGTESRFDYYTLKYSGANGATLWERRYDGPAHDNDVALAIGLDPQGNVIVTGGSPHIGDSYDFFTIEYSSADGAPLWEQHYDGPFENYDAANAAVIDTAGNVIVTGTSIGDSGTGDAYTIKYDESGTILWTHRYHGGGDTYFGQDAGNAVAVDRLGNVAVTGLSVGPEGDPDFYTAKYRAADGVLLWERRYDGPQGSYDEGSFVAIDAGGNVIVAGQSYSRGQDGEASPDFYTAKYAAVDGSLLWERRYHGGRDGDYLTGMKLTPNGDVVVTGSSGGESGEIELYTAKYSGPTGALLWEQRHNGPTSISDFANALAIDAAGNVTVTGSSLNGGSQFRYDIYTARYAAADGRLLWEARYNGPADLDDEAFGVAVDAQGNALITGYAQGRGEIYTAKYRSTDGALLWEQRYPGPAAFGEQVGSAIAVDEAGNAVVSGYSFNGVNTDYYTAKYAAAGGALLWEQRYNGPLMGHDYPAARGLAVGPNGMVAVTGFSDRDYATVVYRDDSAGARGMLTEVLTGLTTVRASVTDGNTGQQLDRAIAHLADALDARLWDDENHLNPETGESVFRESQKTIEILCRLLNTTSANLPNTILNTFIERVIKANRLLASIALEDAIEAGIPKSRVQQAQRFLARGDASSQINPCGKGLEDYGNAWKTLNRANIPAASGGN